MSICKYDKGHPIAIAIDAADGVRNVAAKMGVSTQFIHHCRAEKRVPLERALQFCQITGANPKDVLTAKEVENIRLLAALLCDDSHSSNTAAYPKKSRKVNRKLLF